VKDETPGGEPFIRPMGDGGVADHLPDGWSAQSVGTIGGDVMEVAFQPGRHDVAVVWHGKLPMAVAKRIYESGWAPLACTDTAQVWSRERRPRSIDRLRASRRPLHLARGLEL
jgi:hypothetical protein